MNAAGHDGWAFFLIVDYFLVRLIDATESKFAGSGSVRAVGVAIFCSVGLHRSVVAQDR